MTDHISFIKWGSATLILLAMPLHILGITPYNSILQILGAIGWVYVGIAWKEKSLVLNFFPQIIMILAGLAYFAFFKR